MNRPIRILLATLIGLGLLFGVVAIGAPAAVAKPTPYVTKAEWNQIRKGMPLWKVHRIFDTNGWKRGQGYGELYRQYPDGTKYGGAGIVYKKINGTWKVSSKVAYWTSIEEPVGIPTITHAKFNQIRKGMTMGEVRNTIGTTGTVKQSFAWPAAQENFYRANFNRYHEVTVGYTKVNGTWKVAYKVNGYTNAWGG